MINYLVAFFCLLGLSSLVSAHTDLGTKVYSYQAGCADFSVYEQLPQIERGKASGPAAHHLVITSSDPKSILDGVGVVDAEAENIDPSSFAEAFDKGFVNLAQVPQGIRMMVVAQDATQPFAWRIAAKCHRGGVGLMHFDKIYSSRRKEVPAEVNQVDDVLLGKPRVPVFTSHETQAASRPASGPLNDLDAELAALTTPEVTHRVVAPGFTDMASFNAALIGAEQQHFENTMGEKYALAMELAMETSRTYTNQRHALSAHHLEQYLEAKRRESERIAREQREAAQRKQDGQLLTGLAAGLFTAATLGNAGVTNAGSIGGNLGGRIAQGNTADAMAGLSQDLSNIDWQQSGNPVSTTSSTTHYNASANAISPDYLSNNQAPSKTKTSSSNNRGRCAVNGYLGSERTVYWDGFSLSCGNGGSPRVDANSGHWAGLSCAGDSRGPGSERTCSGSEQQAAQRAAAQMLPPDVARKYGLSK